MNELTLLLFGCGVFFVFSSGCYIYIRENMLFGKATPVPYVAKSASELRIV